MMYVMTPLQLIGLIAMVLLTITAWLGAVLYAVIKKDGFGASACILIFLACIVCLALDIGSLRVGIP